MKHLRTFMAVTVGIITAVMVNTAQATLVLQTSGTVTWNAGAGLTADVGYQVDYNDVSLLYIYNYQIKPTGVTPDIGSFSAFFNTVGAGILAAAPTAPADMLGGTPVGSVTLNLISGASVNWVVAGLNQPPLGNESRVMAFSSPRTWTLGGGGALEGATFSSTSSTQIAVPVPEPTTMIAGALLLLPFGASTLRVLRRRTA